MAFTKVAQDRPRVLIVGGGYVGFTVAKKIQKAIKETGGVVTIVEPNPYMTYQPSSPRLQQVPWKAVTQLCRCASTCATPS